MKITNEIVMHKAKAVGFNMIGFAEYEALGDEVDRLNEWLFNNYHAGMEYMERNVEKRKDIREVLPEAKSVISLGLNYYVPEKYLGRENTGKISRYAWGTDYHLVIWEMLNELENEMREIDPAFDSISYVDTGPVMDKVWAVKSGLGWMGKHTNVITKEFGSWIFLATVITNYEFNYAQEMPDFCGTCTACIDACPTSAIINPYLVDSNKCISYLTIENKKEIPDEFNGKFNDWLFGCDICQDVCPWNIKFAEETSNREFYPSERKTEIDLNEVLQMENSEFKKRFERSPIKRAKLKGLKRNAEFLINSKK